MQVMEDRPDLIASELSGLAFDSLQQCFRYRAQNALYALIQKTNPTNKTGRRTSSA